MPRIFDRLPVGRWLLRCRCEREQSLSTLAAYTACKRGLGSEDEIQDPEAILVSGHVNNALGINLIRCSDRSQDEGKRYVLKEGARVIAMIARLASPMEMENIEGWAAFAAGQSDREKPAYGVHESWWLAEAEAVMRVLGPPWESQD